MQMESPLREYYVYLNRNLALIDMRKLGYNVCNLFHDIVEMH